MSSTGTPAPNKTLLPAVIAKAGAAPRAVFQPVRSIRQIMATPPDEPDVFDEMTLTEHLDELRGRIVKVCLAVALSFLIGILLANHALDLILHQTTIHRFQINDATENITDYFKMALYIAIMISFPIIFYQAFAFISPGLTRKEKHLIIRSLPIAAFLFLAGASFAFFFAIPHAFHFLAGFNSSRFDYEPTFSSVASFYAQVSLGMGFAFQTPIAMFLLARIGILSSKRFASFRKYALVLVLIAAAIITPTPDPFNMMIVAAPIYALYEVGIVFARIGERRRTAPRGI